MPKQQKRLKNQRMKSNDGYVVSGFYISSIGVLNNNRVYDINLITREFEKMEDSFAKQITINPWVEHSVERCVTTT